MSIRTKLGTINKMVSRRDELTVEEKESVVGYLLIGPAVVLILGLIGYPLVYNVWLSLHNVPLSPQEPLEWVGFEHYSELLVSKRFWESVGTTLAYTLGSDILATVGGLAAALLFTRKIRGKSIGRAIVLVPYIAPLVASAYIWRWMFNPVNGIVTHYGVQLGLFNPQPEPLQQSGSALVILILFDGWRHIPFAFLFFTARLQAIPEELYEAGRIDGAGRIAMFRDITLPELKYTIAIVFLLRFIWNFHKFAPVWLLTRHVETLSVFTFVTAFSKFEYGPAAAVSIIIAVILVILATVYIRYFMEW